MSEITGGMPMGLGKLGLQIDLGENSLGLSIISGSDTLLGVTIGASTSSEKVNITLPSDILSGEYSEEWASYLDLDVLKQRLIAAGVPSALVDTLFAEVLPTV